jgi:hypothetical protein
MPSGSHDQPKSIPQKRGFDWLPEARKAASLSRQRRAGKNRWSVMDLTDTIQPQADGLSALKQHDIRMTEFNVHLDGVSQRDYTVTIESSRQEIEAYEKWYTDVFMSLAPPTSLEDWKISNDTLIGQVDEEDFIPLNLDAPLNVTQKVCIKRPLRVHFSPQVLGGSSARLEGSY